MSESPPEQSKKDAIPFAVAAPFLVLLSQAVWVVHSGEDFSRRALLARAFHPAVLAGMVFIGFFTYFAIRSSGEGAFNRWANLIGCALAFTFLILVLSP